MEYPTKVKIDLKKQLALIALFFRQIFTNDFDFEAVFSQDM